MGTPPEVTGSEMLEVLEETVSIQLMSPASGDSMPKPPLGKCWLSFHSINVPSEWGLTLLREYVTDCGKVSIQLMSPASGDLLYSGNMLRIVERFPFN